MRDLCLKRGDALVARADRSLHVLGLEPLRDMLRAVHVPRHQVQVRTRMTASAADAAIAAAALGLGLTRVLSYQVADALRDGRLVRVLTPDEPPRCL